MTRRPVTGDPSGPDTLSGPAVSVIGNATDGHAVSLCPELVDLITEAVAMPSTAAARAEVISTMLFRALDAVTWRHGPAGDGGEEGSLLRVVEAAAAHRLRMAALSVPLR